MDANLKAFTEYWDRGTETCLADQLGGDCPTGQMFCFKVITFYTALQTVYDTLRRNTVSKDVILGVFWLKFLKTYFLTCLAVTYFADSPLQLHSSDTFLVGWY